MKVRQFLNSYNIGRSSAKKAVVVDVVTGNSYPFSEHDMMESAYGQAGNMKLNTFTIAEDKLVIYAE